MLTLTSLGLYCELGNFYVDPSGSVENAVITHAHSDHARRGAKRYFSTVSGEALLRARLGQSIQVTPFPYGERFILGAVSVSFHSAGHILGSAQVRIEHAGEVWVVSGDYKREHDPTCEPFEVVPCDVFVTEATFGTPSFQWRKNADVGREILQWWEDNASQGRNSVLFAYSLGKTQRLLALLAPFAKRAIHCHEASEKINNCYRSQGIVLAPTKSLSEVSLSERFAGEFILAPQSFLDTEQAQILGGKYETAFASGWMLRPREGLKGFVLSDHADWDDLVKTIQETGAKKVFVQHRGFGALVKHLRSIPLEAHPLRELALGRTYQLPIHYTVK